MGKQQLSEVLVQDLPLGIHQLYPHIAQGQPLHPLAVLPGGLQGHQASLGLNNGVAQGLGEGVAVSRGAGGGIAGSPGGQNHRRGLKNALVGLHTGDPALLGQDLRDPGRLHHSAGGPEGPLEAIQYRPGAVGLGKHPVPPLGFQGASVFFKEGLGFLRRKGRQGAVEESAIPWRVLQDLLG